MTVPMSKGGPGCRGRRCFRRLHGPPAVGTATRSAALRAGSRSSARPAARVSGARNGQASTRRGVAQPSRARPPSQLRHRGPQADSRSSGIRAPGRFRSQPRPRRRSLPLPGLLARRAASLSCVSLVAAAGPTSTRTTLTPARAGEWHGRARLEPGRPAATAAILSQRTWDRRQRADQRQAAGSGTLAGNGRPSGGQLGWPSLLFSGGRISPEVIGHL